MSLLLLKGLICFWGITTNSKVVFLYSFPLPNEIVVLYLMSKMPTAGNAVYDGTTFGRILAECDRCSKEMQLVSCLSQMPQETVKNFPHTKRVGNYLVGRMINKGSFAKVMEGLHIPTGQKVAMKVIDKKKAKQDSYVLKNMKREPRIHQMIKHPNIVQLYETLETENSYYMVMELCPGGDLMDKICEKKKLDENDVRKYTRQIMSAVEHLHCHGIVHRDLKIENFLLDENGNIKIVDFGLSNTIQYNGLSHELLNTQCGSPAYAAPELLANKKYGPKVDVWSIGVCMFAMLTATLPFAVEPFNIKQLLQKMKNGDITPIEPDISKGAVHLVHTLLQPDPQKRPTIKEAMKDKWLNESWKPLGSISHKNRLRPDELNSVVLKYMSTTMNILISEMTNIIVNNKPSPTLASYCLLLKRINKHQMEFEFTKNDKLDLKYRREHCSCTEDQGNAKLCVETLKNTVETLKSKAVKKSLVLCEPIQEDEIAITLDNQENLQKASKFADREMVYLDLPDYSKPQKIDASTRLTPLSNKDLNQQDVLQEDITNVAESKNSEPRTKDQHTKVQNHQVHDPSSSYIVKAKSMPVNRHVNDLLPYQKKGVRLKEQKSAVDKVPFICLQHQDREISDTAHQSTLPQLRQPGLRDNFTKKVAWVTSSQNTKTGPSPSGINVIRPSVFPMLDGRKTKRIMIQLVAANKPTKQNLPLLLSCQKRSEKK
ncbi:hormonally up-regulated neu tumor-associated kinase homolog A-like [Hyla sarda]|uniref:hormonally up-regulated neu tumor-associated kinase homolog A-like n=1 Tax=Hyla sarda TaxID=327740 RepID=UPI0024C283F5|nr:hormonally up-regulated neu tumor-associated kinase homolog A-like [Hyla sarda]